MAILNSTEQWFENPYAGGSIPPQAVKFQLPCSEGQCRLSKPIVYPNPDPDQ